MRHSPILPLLLLLLPAVTAAQIEVYFNKAIDSSLAYPPGNVARGGSDLALITAKELGRARYSIDMAVYSLNHPAVADALIAARERGVRVRVIGDAGNLDDPGARFRAVARSGIPMLANRRAPDGEPQPLMHNKFFVIDGRPGAPSDADPVTITGSWNPTSAQTYDDPNNLVVIRDSALAATYVAEFEEMWGGGGDQPDTALSRFGAAKRSNTRHEFTLADGTRIESRFSPSDSVSRRINAMLAGGRASICTANLTFTYATFAKTLDARSRGGADIRSIVDATDDQGSQFGLLSTFADAHDWTLPGLFHHKYAVVDAPPFGDEGASLVITGSHNWSLSAETRNDENMVIIFNARIANQYLQEFAMRYREVGGTRRFVSVGGIAAEHNEHMELHASPNPFNGRVGVTAEMRPGETGEIAIADATGREMMRAPVSHDEPGIVWETGGAPSGVYFVMLRAGGRSAHLRLMLAR